MTAAGDRSASRSLVNANVRISRLMVVTSRVLNRLCEDRSVQDACYDGWIAGDDTADGQRAAAGIWARATAARDGVPS